MKKTICILAAILLLFCSCSSPAVQNAVTENVQQTETLQRTSAQPTAPAAAETEPAPQPSTDVKNPYTGDMTPADGLEYESNGDGTCSIIGVGSFTAENLVIPAKSPAGDLVTQIGEYAFNRTSFSAIVISELTLELDESAFYGCDFQDLVVLDSTLTVGASAFSYTDGIASVTVIGGSCEIEGYSFYKAGKHMQIAMGGVELTLKDDAFSGCMEDSILLNGCNAEIGKNAFSYADYLTNVQFQNCDLEIGGYAFYRSGDDAQYVIDGCTIEADESAFSGCGAETFTITNCKDVSLGDNCIAYCDDLTAVTVSCDSLIVGEYAFYSNDDMKTLDMNAGSGKIVLEDSAVSGAGKLETVTLTCGEITIGDNAFAYNDDLVSVKITGEITKKGDYVFYRCADELIIDVNGQTYSEKTF